MTRRPTYFSLVAVLAFFAFVASACSQSDPAPVSVTVSTALTAQAATPSTPAASAGKRIKTGRTSYGTILQDSRGRSIYLFTKEKSVKSRCFGACSTAWPPVYTSGSPVADGGGVKQSKLGTTKHGKKTQATYNGHPLYYYYEEDEPNEVLCQAVFKYGGYWYVINKNGNAITAKG